MLKQRTHHHNRLVQISKEEKWIKSQPNDVLLYLYTLALCQPLYFFRLPIISRNDYPAKPTEIDQARTDKYYYYYMPLYHSESQFHKKKYIFGLLLLSCCSLSLLIVDVFLYSRGRDERMRLRCEVDSHVFYVHFIDKHTDLSHIVTLYWKWKILGKWNRKRLGSCK